MSNALNPVEQNIAQQFKLSGLLSNPNLVANQAYVKYINDNKDKILKGVTPLVDTNNQEAVLKKLIEVVNNPAAVEEIINQQNSKSGGGQANTGGNNTDNLGTAGTNNETTNGATAIAPANVKAPTREDDYNIKKFTEQFPNNLPHQEVLKKIDEYGIRPMLDINFVNNRRNYMGLAPNPAPASNMNPEFEKIIVQKFKEKFPKLLIGLSDKQIAYALSKAPEGSLLGKALKKELNDFNNKLKPTIPSLTPNQQTPKQTPIIEIAKSLNLNRTAAIAMHYAKLTNGGINHKDKSLYAQALVEASKIKALLSATGGGTLTLNDYLSVSTNPALGRQVFMALSSGDNKITGHLEKDNVIVEQVKQAVKDKDIVQNNTQTSDIKLTNKPALTQSR